MRGDWNRWETETLETKVVSNGVEGVPGYPDGEGRHVRELVKIPEGTAKRQEKKVNKSRARDGK